jgi:protein TonB
VTLDRSSGESALDESALEAVRTWRFEPARRNGVPVRAWAIVPVEFKLLDQ